MSKVCESCKVEKTIKDFPSNSRNSDGKNKKCRECYNKYMRAYYSKNKKEHLERVAKTPYQKDSLRKRARVYGVSVEELEAVISKNNGMCDICEVRQASHVDHCHETNLVRGHLCMGCNIGLGHFMDNVEHLNAAINYLSRKHNR